MNMTKVSRVIAPLLVHFGMTVAVAFIGSYLYLLAGSTEVDDTLLTTAASLCCLPVIWNMWKADHELRDSMVPLTKRPWWFYSFAFLCGAAASVALSYLLTMVHLTEFFSNEAQEGLFAGDIILQFVGLGLIIPITEELVFRGVFYQRMREYLPRTAAMILVSVIFALYHGNLVQIIYALPMGFLLIWFYEASGSLKAPILFHMGANLVSVLVQFLSF